MVKVKVPCRVYSSGQEFVTGQSDLVRAGVAPYGRGRAYPISVTFTDHD